MSAPAAPAAVPSAASPEIGLIENILIRRGINQNDEKLEGISALTKMATGINYYALQSDHDIKKLWADIRSVPEVSMLLLDVLHEFIVRMGGSQSPQMKAYMEAWASAMMLTVCRDGYMDDTLRERVQLTNEETTFNFITDNLWLVVLGTIAQTDLPKVIMTVRATIMDLQRMGVR